MSFSSLGRYTSAVPWIYGLTLNSSGQYLMVMQLAKEGTLETTRDATNWRDIVIQAYRLASSLSAIHSEKCTHYDLHPGNVAFIYSDYVTLLDLGLSRSVNDIQHETGVYG